MRRLAGIAALVCGLADVAAAAPARVWIEPFVAGVERLDATWDASGLEGRTAARAGCGVSVDVGRGFAVAAGAGCAAGTTTFGLLAGPAARIVRTDATLELRARAPWSWSGWHVQGALGGGRLRVGYRPDSVVLDTGGGALLVNLPPVHAWTRHVAAEVLHGAGRSVFMVRAGWRWYALDVATPSGIEKRGVRDLHVGAGVRIRVF